jgi:hypothetical protein
MSAVDSDQGQDGIGDPREEIGEAPADIAIRWKMELDAARKGPYQRWLKRAKRSIKRYRDEDMDSEDGAIVRRNAQFNVLWSNVNTVAPSVYSRSPKPIAERRYLDRDTLARAGATILQRCLSYTIEDSGLHETMLQCRTDLFLVGIGSAWLRYEAEYDKTAPQHQEDPTKPPPVDGQAQTYGSPQQQVTKQKTCVDYCHWSDELFSPARFWSEVRWRAKRAYYTRRQLRDRFPKDVANAIPLKTQRGRRQNDVTDQVRETIGTAEVWQIWDFEAREIIWICEDYLAGPLKSMPDKLGLSCFVPAARPVRATTTNDSVWPIPDYSIWLDQAGELDSLTARIAALTRTIKAVGVFDNSFPELERLLQEGMENKLVGVKNWAKLTQRGGLPGSVGLLPIAEMATALTALYQARAQVKQDLYEISGVSDIVRGAGDPNETATAQALKGQFSNVRGGDRKNEFNRFVRDTLCIMAEIILEQYTDEMIWLMSDFEQWARDQDLRSYGPDQPEAPPQMGHNGGPPLDMPAPPMAPQAPLVPDQGQAGMPGQDALQPPVSASPMPAGPAPAPMASSPGIPPVQGLPMGGNPAQPMPQQAAPVPPQIPPQIAARALFDEALALLREDKLRSFRINVETNSTIEPDAMQEKQARVEFLGAVTQFLAQAQEMAAAYPQVMPVLGKMLLFGARGFQVGRELESALEGLISDLERMARNPAPKPPSEDEVKAQAARDKHQFDMQKLQAEAQRDQQTFAMELQKMRAEMQALVEKLQMEREKLQMQLQAEREKSELKRVEGQQNLMLQQQQGALEAQGMNRQAQNDERSARLEAEGMERQAAHDERKVELAEETAEVKAAAAARNANSRGSGAGNGKPRSNA